jgi:hypothetical protein
MEDYFEHVRISQAQGKREVSEGKPREGTPDKT